MANIGFISLGCAKNQVDCERMMYRVREAGHTVKEDITGSDVVVINTCGFIDSAKAEAIDYILRTAALKSDGQVGKILVTGCLSQRYQQEILKEMPDSKLEKSIAALMLFPVHALAKVEFHGDTLQLRYPSPDRSSHSCTHRSYS